MMVRMGGRMLQDGASGWHTLRLKVMDGRGTSPNSLSVLQWVCKEGTWEGG